MLGTKINSSTGILFERGKVSDIGQYILNPHRKALLAYKTLGRRQEATSDIGDYANTVTANNPDITASPTSDRDRILHKIHSEIGPKQVTAQKLDFAPPWILEEAFNKEHEANWTDAYHPVRDEDVPRHANIISAHTVYKVKTQEDGRRQMKGRIVPLGNRDDGKDRIRKDSSTAPLFVIRLLLSLIIFLDFRIATADIKGASLQSGPS